MTHIFQTSVLLWHLYSCVLCNNGRCRTYVETHEKGQKKPSFYFGNSCTELSKTVFPCMVKVQDDRDDLKKN